MRRYLMPVIFVVAVLGVLLNTYMHPRLSSLMAALGGICNLIAVGFNGWMMPVAGRRGKPTARHRNLNKKTKFKALCDVIKVSIFRTPITLNISIGDVLILTGIYTSFVRH